MIKKITLLFMSMFPVFIFGSDIEREKSAESFVRTCIKDHNENGQLAVGIKAKLSSWLLFVYEKGSLEPKSLSKVAVDCDGRFCLESLAFIKKYIGKDSQGIDRICSNNQGCDASCICPTVVDLQVTDNGDVKNLILIMNKVRISTGAYGKKCYRYFDVDLPTPKVPTTHYIQ